MRHEDVEDGRVPDRHPEDWSRSPDRSVRARTDQYAGPSASRPVMETPDPAPDQVSYPIGDYDREDRATTSSPGARTTRPHQPLASAAHRENRRPAHRRRKPRRPRERVHHPNPSTTTSTAPARITSRPETMTAGRQATSGDQQRPLQPPPPWSFGARQLRLGSSGRPSGWAW